MPRGSGSRASTRRPRGHAASARCCGMSSMVSSGTSSRVGIGAGADAVEHRIAGRLQRRARPGTAIGAGVDRGGRALSRRRRRVPPSRSRKVLAPGIGGKPCTHDPAARAVGFERIALPLVFAAQIEDQAGEEDPEDVEHDLGHVDVAGDGAGMAWHDLRTMLASREIRQARTWLTAARGSIVRAHERADRDQGGEQQRNFDVVDDAVAGGRVGQRRAEQHRASPGRRPRRGWRRRARSRTPAAVACTAPQAPSAKPALAVAGESPSPRSACRRRTARRRNRSGSRRARNSSARCQRRGKDHGRKREQPDQRAEAGEPIGIAAAPERARGEREARRASRLRKKRGERRGLRRR